MQLSYASTKKVYREIASAIDCIFFVQFRVFYNKEVTRLKKVINKLLHKSAIMALCYADNCHRADPTYGEGVAKALRLSLSEALTAEDPAHPKWDWR